MKAYILTRTGTPDVLEWAEVRLPPPRNGEVRVRHTAIGLNFVDTYHRSGLYPVQLPSGLGLEAAGVVEAVGADVKDIKAGDRVAYGTGPAGAYAQARNMAADLLIKLPASISDETAAAMMLKGMTVRYLLRATYRVKRGETIVIHAAAGGVGSIACQWARALGAKVIGTVGSKEKEAIAKANGCSHVINYRTEDVAGRVREITRGNGVPVVYDGIGQATVMSSLDCLQPRGLLVSFGNASGPVRNFDFGTLASKGSLYVTRPLLGTYTATRALLRESAEDVIRMVGSGKIRIPINQRFPLRDASKAHRALEARETVGATILVP